MYLSSSRTNDAITTARTDTSSGTRPSRRARLLPVVAPNVLALGMVSLVTDISAEMVTAILPVYLVVGLGLSPLAFGMLDGLYNVANAAVRPIGGHVADRTRRHKPVAGVGYAVSAAGKLALPAVAGSVPLIGGVLAADRMGKGLRTAPRDALISLSSPDDAQGRAFGVHRAMDTTGALLGPPVALLVLWVTVEAYDAVFVVSFCFAMLGVLILALFVREPTLDRTAATRRKVRLLDAVAVLRAPGFGRVCACALLLACVTVGDSMLYLLLQRRVDLSPALFPLLPFGTALAFLLLALPFGLLGDRFGRGRVFLAGHLILLAACLTLLLPLPGAAAIGGTLVLLGAFYAATDGVLMALAAPLAPADLRAGALGLVQTGQAAGRAVGAVAFGAAWTAWGPRTALAAAALGLAMATTVAATLLRGRPAVPTDPHDDTDRHDGDA